MTELSYCGAEVRRHDPDRFLAALFTPVERREAVFALLAFNLEIAKTREVVSEPMLGRIRLQWWREAVDGAYAGTPRHHAVVEPLAAAIAAHDLSRAGFDVLIDAREQDLADTAPTDLDALVAYARDTAAPLLRLWLEVLDVRDGPAQEAAQDLGIAFALAGLMRRVPVDAADRRVTLPTRLVEEVAVDMGELFEMHPHDALARGIGRVCDRAEAHLAAARNHRRAVPRAALPALLPGVVARSHLRTLRRCGHNVFDPRVARRPPLLAANLLWHAWRRRY